MLSTQYRLRLEAICEKIAQHEEVSLEDMIWAEKLAKANRSAATLLRQARRRAANPNMQEGSLDDFMNQLDLGDPDPSNHRSGFTTADDIINFFSEDKPEDWRQHD
jgi:membrane protein involved in colicin uptake